MFDFRRSHACAIAVAALFCVLAPDLKSAPLQNQFWTLFEKYEAGDVHIVERSLLTLVDYQNIRKAYLKAIGDWKKAWHRLPGMWRPIYSAFGLEVATVAVSHDWAVESEAVTLAYSLVATRPNRGGEIRKYDQFELLFHRTALALLERYRVADGQDAYFELLKERVADDPLSLDDSGLLEPRLLLMFAIALEQRTTPGAIAIMRERSFGAPAELEPQIRHRLEESAQRFRKAAESPRAAEASVRLSRVLWRLGRFQEALTALAPAIQDNSDREVTYLAHLFGARALMSLGKTDEAIRSYETALEVWPNAPAATAALSVSNVLRGQIDRGVEWAQRARTQPDVLDPWWRYWEGLGRFFPAWLDELRKAAR